MRHEAVPSITAMPMRIMPSPWEDLASLISRLGEQMGYKNPAWILRPEDIPYVVQPFTLCQLRDKADYRFFEQLLRLDEECLYQLTLHRFASGIQAPEAVDGIEAREINRPLLRRYTFQSFFHPYSATKVCPRCLCEEPAYGRLYWSALPVVACSQHGIFLIDACPSCRRPIPALRSPLTKCPSCKNGDYREAQAFPMPEDVFFRVGQKLLLDRLGVAVIDQFEVAALASPLVELYPHQYFQLFDAFRHVLQPLFPDAPLLRVAPELRNMLHERGHARSAFSLLEWSVFISTFHALFDSWPDAFFSFLHAFPQARSGRARKRDQERQTGVQRDYGVFYERWLYKRLTDPAFSFLQGAFEDYLKRRYTGGEITRRLLPFKERIDEQWQERVFLTKAQTRAALGIGEDTLQSLLKQGILRVHRKPLGGTKRRNVFLIDRASVEALQQEWSALIPLNALAGSKLGVTKAVVLSLEQVGMLTPRRSPSVDGYKVRLYSQADIVRFEQALLSHALSVTVPPTATLSLPHVSRQTGVALVEILKEVFDNRLPILEVSGNQPLFQRLVLPCAGVSDFLQRYKRRQYRERGLLTIGEAASRIGVGERVLRRWARCGLLESEKLVIGGKQPPLLFRREVIEAFLCTYAFMNEVADQLRVALHTVRKYVHSGILHPVMGRMAGVEGNELIFLRDEVEAFLASRGLENDQVLQQ